MAFLPQEIIAAKRDGRSLSASDIEAFVSGVGSGQVTDAQIAAFAMAVFLRGMESGETIALTRAMRDSGDVLAWPEIDRPILDKHSTGGIGDNVSLMLAPILAACGGAVPMISGRGLGHTGGTLDKLESIPGYGIAPDEATFRRTLADVGCAVVGPTGSFAPADKRFYAVRDVTATVESTALITASILSKKLAAGLEGLVLDVKTGSGAFMAKPEDARRLARTMVEVGRGAGLRTSALVTDMNEALASAAGNAVEVRNAVRFLDGTHRDPRLLDVTLALAAEMLVFGGLASDIADARRKAEMALNNGEAAERFGRMVSALGGPADLVDRMDLYLPEAPLVMEARADQAGFLRTVDARELGLAVVALGGGRTRAEDAVDHAVGLTELASLGAHVDAGEPLALVHARTREGGEEAVRRVVAAYRIGDAPPPERPVVIERIG